MSTETCPNCKKEIAQYATRCPYCTTWFDEPIGMVSSEPSGPIGAAVGDLFAFIFVGGMTIAFLLISAFLVNMLCGATIKYSGFLTALGGIAFANVFRIYELRSGEASDDHIGPLTRFLFRYLDPHAVFYGVIFAGLFFLVVTAIMNPWS